MKNLQDKICNGLTFIGLVAVIGWGVVSLLPESERENPEPVEEMTPVDAPEEVPVQPVQPVKQVPLETMQELPMVEDPIPVVKKDSLSSDSLATVQDSLAGSVAVPDSLQTQASAKVNPPLSEIPSSEPHPVDSVPQDTGDSLQ